MKERDKLTSWTWALLLFGWPLLLTALIYGCDKDIRHKSKAKEAAAPVFADYYFIDERNCIHRPECIRLKYDDSALHYGGYLEKEHLSDYPERVLFCPTCIDYEEFKAIVELLY